MIKNFTKNNKGSSLLETVFYVSLLAVLAIVVINSLLTMTKSFKETTMHAQIAQSAHIMEKISREIRQAHTISTLTASNLVLDTTDELGVGRSVQFLLSGTDVQFLEDSSLVGNLNAPGVSVNSLQFSQITTTAGTAVKVSLNVSSSSDSQGRTYDFFDTVVLRGDY